MDQAFTYLLSKHTFWALLNASPLIWPYTRNTEAAELGLISKPIQWERKNSQDWLISYGSSAEFERAHEIAFVSRWISCERPMEFLLESPCGHCQIQLHRRSQAHRHASPLETIANVRGLNTVCSLWHPIWLLFGTVLRLFGLPGLWWSFNHCTFKKNLPALLCNCSCVIGWWTAMLYGDFISVLLLNFKLLDTHL